MGTNMQRQAVPLLVSKPLLLGRAWNTKSSGLGVLQLLAEIVE
jgi:hypothetical protein